MKYQQAQTLTVEPDIEKIVVDEDPEQVELNNEDIEVRTVQRIHSDSNPFITYWEIRFTHDTPNHDAGDTRIVTEHMLNKMVQPDN